MTTTLLALLGIYGFGVLSTLCLGMCAFAYLVADYPRPHILRDSLKLCMTTLVASICWPWLIAKDAVFRDIVLTMGGMGVLLGYLFAALMTPIYPLIWVWYLLGVGVFLVLRRYHDRQTLAGGG